MSAEVVAGQEMAYTRDEYLRLANEYLNDAILRLEGKTTIEQSIEIAEVFALMALATRDQVPEELGQVVDRLLHPADPRFVPALPEP